MATYLEDLAALRLYLHIKTLRTMVGGVGGTFSYCQIHIPRRPQDETETVPAWLRLLAVEPPHTDCQPAHALARRWRAEIADEAPYAMPPSRGKWLMKWHDRLTEPTCDRHPEGVSAGGSPPTHAVGHASRG